MQTYGSMEGSNEALGVRCRLEVATKRWELGVDLWEQRSVGSSV